MQLKKLLQGSAFALVAAACAIAAPTVAKAAGTGAFADAGIGEVKVYGASAYMTVKGGTNVKEIQVGFGKTNKSGKITVASWESYEAVSDGVTIDLSKLNSTKDNYVVLTSPGKTEVSIVKIPANVKAIKGKFNAKDGVIQVSSGDKAGTPENLTPSTATNYEYRTVYGNWKDLASGTGESAKLTSMAMYQEEGAKLTIRKKSDVKVTVSGTTSTEAPDALSSQDSAESYTYGDSKVKSEVYKACSLPSKEAKVTVPAKAKGPKITADYVNGTIKFPSKSEYRLLVTKDTPKYLYKTDATSTPFESPSDKITPTDLANNSKGSGTAPTEYYLEVRTSATDKKSASKWASIKVETPVDLTAGTNKLLDNTTGNDRTKWSTSTGRDATSGKLKDPAEAEAKGTGAGGLKYAKLVEKDGETVGTTSVLNIEYIAAGAVKEKYFEANAVKIENKGKKTYEVVKSASEPEATAKGTKIAPGKSVTIKNVKDSEHFYIRLLGDKKAQTWTSKFAELGVVDFPFTIPKKETTTNS